MTQSVSRLFLSSPGVKNGFHTFRQRKKSKEEYFMMSKNDMRFKISVSTNNFGVHK